MFRTFGDHEILVGCGGSVLYGNCIHIHCELDSELHFPIEVEAETPLDRNQAGIKSIH